MLNLAIVGLGFWGRRLVDSVQGVSSAVRFSTAVVSRPRNAAEYAAKQKLTLETDFDKVLRDASIDGVVSCGPAQLHAAHSLKALQGGKPVLAVKPMALSSAEAEELVAAAERNRVLLALGYNRCFFPNVLEMRRRLKAGALGRLLHAEGDFCVDRYRGVKQDSWKADPSYALAGSLADHMLYLTVECLGPISEVFAIAFSGVSENQLADTTAVALQTAGGTSALLTAIGVTPDYYRFQLFGSEGWIELRDASRFVFQPRNGQREELTLPEVDTERVELEAFAAAVRGEHAFPTPMADAAHSVAVLEAINRSALERRVVPLAR